MDTNHKKYEAIPLPMALTLKPSIQTSDASSQPSVMLVPCSADAVVAMRLRTNRSWLAGQTVNAEAGAGAYDKMKGGQSQPRPMARLAYRTLLRRQCLSFGSSVSNDFQLSEGDEVASTHFLLHLEAVTGVLLLSDVSPHGTWVSTEYTEGLQLLRGATLPLLQLTEVHLGRDRGVRFHLYPYEQQQVSASEFPTSDTHQDVYAQQNIHFGQLRRLSKPCILPGDTYMKIQRVGPGQYEVINTCIRLTDGHLFALKTITYGNAGVHHQAIATVPTHSHMRISPLLLRQLNHPNIVRTFDSTSSEQATLLFMDYLHHGSLATMLARISPLALEHQHVQALARQCLYALDYLHKRRLCHGNIRAESILIQSEQPLKVRLGNVDQCLQERIDGKSYGGDLRDLGLLLLVVLGHLPRDISPDRLHDLRFLDKPASRHAYFSLLRQMLGTSSSDQSAAERCLGNPWLCFSPDLKRKCSIPGSAQLLVVKHRCPRVWKTEAITKRAQGQNGGMTP